MRGTVTLIRRELGATFRTAGGWVVLALTLLVDGLMFNAWAIGTTQRRSSEVLEVFFYATSGTTLVLAVVLAMRLFAEERQQGTWVLLASSPLAEWQVVLGKFLAAWLTLGLMTGCTAYMPALILWHGKISWGHIAAGYTGLLLLGGATLALGLLCSVLAPNQLVAALLGAALVSLFVVFWLLARIVEPPLDGILAFLSLHDRHFRPFMRGLISTSDVVFYLSLSYVALGAATRALESRRWQ